MPSKNWTKRLENYSDTRLTTQRHGLELLDLKHAFSMIYNAIRAVLPRLYTQSIPCRHVPDPFYPLSHNPPELLRVGLPRSGGTGIMRADDRAIHLRIGGFVMEQGIARAGLMSVEEAIDSRRSVRGYVDRPVPREILTKVFEMAQHAPSNCNIQPWVVMVASGPARDRIRQRLIDGVINGVPSNPDFDYPGRFEGDYRRRQVDCAVALYEKMGIGREDHAGRARASLRNFELFDAPHVAFIGMHKDFGATVAIDVGVYLQSLMLAMTTHGIACCAQGSMRYYPDIVREEFLGHDDIRILVGISFGYEDPAVPANAARTTRDDISINVTFKD